MNKILSAILIDLVLSASTLIMTPAFAGETYDPVGDYYSRYYGVEAPAPAPAIETGQARVAQARSGESYDPVLDYYDRYYGLSQIATTPTHYRPIREDASAPTAAPAQRSVQISLMDAMCDPGVYYNGDY